jgi:hypothetical protein
MKRLIERIAQTIYAADKRDRMRGRAWEQAGDQMQARYLALAVDVLSLVENVERQETGQ